MGVDKLKPPQRTCCAGLHHTCRRWHMEHLGTGQLSEEPGPLRYHYKAETHTPWVGGSSQKSSIITEGVCRVISILRGAFLSSPVPVPVKHPSMSFLENCPQAACKAGTIKDGGLGGLLAGRWGYYGCCHEHCTGHNPDLCTQSAYERFDVQDCGTVKTVIILGAWSCFFPQLFLFPLSFFHSAQFGSVRLGASACCP